MRKLFLALTLIPFLTQPAGAAIELRSSGAHTNFLFERDPKDLASTVMLVFGTGGISDPKGKEGLTEVAFQTLFRGTKDKDRKEFNSALERLGASVSVETGALRTLVTLTAVSENLGPALNLVADSVIHPALKEEEVKLVAEEKLSQLQQELSSNRAVMKRVLRLALYQGTPLAFPADGTIDGAKKITAEEVRALLAKHVKSENLLFAVATNRSEKEVRKMISTAFASLPEGSAPAAPELKPATKAGRHLYVVERKGSSTTELGIVAPGIKADRPDRLALEAAQYAFGEGSMTARLFQVLRAQNGWTYGAYSGFSMLDPPRRFGGAYMIYAFPQGEHTEKLTLKALEMYGDFIKKGVTAEELDYSKKSMGNSYPFKLASSRARLSGRIYELLDGAPFRSVTEYRREINALTPASVLKSIQAAQNAENLAIVAVGDPAQIEGLKKSIPNLKSVVIVKDPMKEL